MGHGAVSAYKLPVEEDSNISITVEGHRLFSVRLLGKETKIDHNEITIDVEVTNELHVVSINLYLLHWPEMPEECLTSR